MLNKLINKMAQAKHTPKMKEVRIKLGQIADLESKLKQLEQEINDILDAK